MPTRHPHVIAAVAALLILPATSTASTHVDRLVHHATPDPFRCNVGRPSWTPDENRCVVRVVFRRKRWLANEAASIVNCESQWDEQQVTPPYGATGLAQFIRSTWRRLPWHYSHHSPKNPVWNVRAMKHVWIEDHDWGQWVCQP